MSRPKPRRFRWVCRWATTTATVVIACAFLYSVRHAAWWTNESLTRFVMIGAGSIDYSWSPPGAWQNLKIPPQPGWSGSAEPFDGRRLDWWIRAYKDPRLEGISFPLWLPLLAFAVPAACLWYRDRRQVAQHAVGVLNRLQPTHRLTISARHVIIALIGHLIVVLVLFRPLAGEAIEHLVPGRARRIELHEMLVDLALPFLFLGAPAFAILYAVLWIGFRNRLLARHRDGPLCTACRYNLTGNVSGRCPECGEATGTDDSGTATS